MRGNGACNLCVTFSRSGMNSRSRFCAANPPNANAVRVSAWLRLLNPVGKYRLPTNPARSYKVRYSDSIVVRIRFVDERKCECVKASD
jgi:hypothetical protein